MVVFHGDNSMSKVCVSNHLSNIHSSCVLYCIIEVDPTASSILVFYVMQIGVFQRLVIDVIRLMFHVWKKYLTSAHTKRNIIQIYGVEGTS